MSRVVILNGPAGVGKTTVGRLLAGRVTNGVCIEGDALASFIVTRVPGAVRAGLGYENGATIAANYLRGGYELVVFEYCFEERPRRAVPRCLHDGGTGVPLHALGTARGHPAARGCARGEAAARRSRPDVLRGHGAASR